MIRGKSVKINIGDEKLKDVGERLDAVLSGFDDVVAEHFDGTFGDIEVNIRFVRNGDMVTMLYGKNAR